MCLACYNFSARNTEPGPCGACGRHLLLKKGYCRLCWCQAREDRAVVADNSRAAVVLAPYLPKVGFHQLFFADLYRRRAAPRAFPRRYGVKGRPLKPAPPSATRPAARAVQLTLVDLPRAYQYGQIDLRSTGAPHNPWVAWALHLAHTIAEARGLDDAVRRTLNRNLVVLMTGHVDGDVIRVSDIQHVVRGASLALINEILDTMGVLVDDRQRGFDTWLEAKLDGLAPAIAAEAERWARVLHDGGLRRRPRSPATAAGYLRVARPALLAWSARYDHLREVTHDDVVAYVDTLRGDKRMAGLVALRSLFTWAKRDGVIFGNPASRIRVGQREFPVWQRLSADDIAASMKAATTPQARLCVALAAVHAARLGQIRAVKLSDVDLGNRRLTIAGRARPLDELTHRLLIEWLDYRRARWPNTANQHLLISRESALGHGPVSATWILDLRGLPGTLERLRIDRQLEEALESGADPLRLAAMFGIEATTAIRYATNARCLLEETHAARSSASARTQASDPDNDGGEHLSSA